MLSHFIEEDLYQLEFQDVFGCVFFGLCGCTDDIEAVVVAVSFVGVSVRLDAWKVLFTGRINITEL